MKPIKLFFLICLVSTSFGVKAEPIGTAFTYQGELQQLGEPANGVFDFEFDLYDVSTDGSPVSTTVILEDVVVTAGVFTVELDYGVEAFDSGQLWLEIAVRDGLSDGVYAVLEPRQKLTVSPYALGVRSRLGALEAEVVGLEDRVKTLECQSEGLENCDGVCINTEEDTTNCGGCGIVCGDLIICYEGVCGGLCPVGTNCNDDNECTVDSCDPFTGCVNEVDTQQGCDDQNACTIGDQCYGDGSCSGTPKDCNDNLSCTDDFCDPLTGECTSSLQVDTCLIDSTCWESGDSNPANPLESCQPLIDPLNWTET